MFAQRLDNGLAAVNDEKKLIFKLKVGRCKVNLLSFWCIFYSQEVCDYMYMSKLLQLLDIASDRQCILDDTRDYVIELNIDLNK